MIYVEELSKKSNYNWMRLVFLIIVFLFDILALEFLVLLQVPFHKSM